jgi:23S rRNA A1618 N6-methylase RlmF
MWLRRMRAAEREQVSDNVSRGQQAAEEVARRWIATMQSVADQIQRQQQTLQQMMQDQMSSYVQLLQNPPFYVSQRPQVEGQKAAGQTFHQASEQWMQLAQKQLQAFQGMSQQWLEQATAQQQAFQQVVQQSLGAYVDLFAPPK